MSKRKKIFLFINISLAAILYHVVFTGGGTQDHIDSYPKIGSKVRKVRFKQPIGYIVRRSASIVPIVAEIKNELGSIHPKLNSEALNQFIPSDTNFTLTDIYMYKDIVNPPTYYYVLLDQKNVRYIVEEEFFKRLTKPVYPGAIAPVSLFDDLYRNKNSIQMKFTAIKSRNTRLTSEFFSECKVQDFRVLKWEQEATATVNFNQLVCLYHYFWDDFNSETSPISFEVLK